MSENELKNNDFNPMYVDPNTFIVERYNELLLIKDAQKDLRIEKNEAFNNDDNLLEIINALDELKQTLTPLKEKLKVAKAEFKVKNTPIFEKELLLKMKEQWLKNELAKAYAIKEGKNDMSPILINNGKKELIIQLTPKVTKQKII